jgi:hypothetical protein
MKFCTPPIHRYAGNPGERRRRMKAQLMKLQRVVEQVAGVLDAGHLTEGWMPGWCMPGPLAPVFIARIGKRFAFRLSLPAAHVR